MAEHEETGVDRVRSIVAGYAGLCLRDLVEAGEMPRAEVASAAEGDWLVIAIAMLKPSAESLPDLAACDYDCLQLLAQDPRPLSVASVRRRLEKDGIGVWGIATVKRSLARLKRLGIICNSRK